MTQQTPPKAYAAQSLKLYKRHRFQGMNRRDVLVMTYEILLKAIQEENQQKALHILQVLSDGIKPKSNPLLAFHYLKLYKYAEKSIIEEEWQEADRIIFNLKRMWSMVDSKAIEKLSPKA